MNVIKMETRAAARRRQEAAQRGDTPTTSEAAEAAEAAAAEAVPAEAAEAAAAEAVPAAMERKVWAGHQDQDTGEVQEPGPPLLSSTRYDEVWWCGDEESQLGDTASNHEGQHLTQWIGRGDRSGEMGVTWAWDKAASEHQDECVGGVVRKIVCPKTMFKCVLCNDLKSGILNYRLNFAKIMDFLCGRGFVIFCKSLAFIFLYTLAKKHHDHIHHLTH